MQAVELPLFPIDKKNENLQAKVVSEEQIITPLVEILETTTPQPTSRPSQSLTKSLNDLFPEQQYEEKRVQKAKEVLGKLADEFTEIELKGVVTEVQCLAESWLDDFERNIFNGLTLKELLHEKGGK